MGAVKVKVGRDSFATIDEEDLELVSGYKWGLSHGYAKCGSKGRTISMHRLVMNCPSGMVVDHINHERLDNRRCNLRICTAAQNSANRNSDTGSSSKFLGVHEYPHRQQSGSCIWQAEIKQVKLGIFAVESHAAHAYDRAARAEYGEFANLNFPDFHATLGQLKRWRIPYGQHSHGKDVWRKALLLKRQGRTYTQIARELDTTRTSVRRWVETQKVWNAKPSVQLLQEAK